jgi:DNA-binding transcriptional LysR family regulator
MLEDVHLSDLEALASVAQHGGVRAAARFSGIAQPTLSKRIHRLERACGCLLLDRRQPGKLTTDGERLLPQIAHVVDRVQFLLNNAKHAAYLRLGIACSAGGDRIASAMRQARTEGRELRLVDGTSDDLLNQVAQGRLDGALGRFSYASHDLNVTVIASDRLGVWCKNENNFQPDILAIADCEGIPMVALALGLAAGLEADIHAAWQSAGRIWHPQRRAEGIEAMAALIISGPDIAIVPESLAVGRRPDLRFIPLSNLNAWSRLQLVVAPHLTSRDHDDLQRWLLGREGIRSAKQVHRHQSIIRPGP